MWLAIDAVKKGEADVVVSAGNTGALDGDVAVQSQDDRGHRAAGARRRCGRRSRASRWCSTSGPRSAPTRTHLINLAAMGSAMARVLFDIERPTVGLLNIGVEEVKGLEQVREAGRLLREGNFPHFDYVGFVEGDDIGKGTVDVVVTEGFAGNIALKTAEGTARQFAQYLTQRHEPDLGGAARLSAVAPGLPHAARQDGPAQIQWRGVPRAQWHRDQEPWRRRRRRLRLRHRHGLRHGAL